MILVDTSIWIDHLHKPEPALVELLERSLVLMHPLVIGELALGSIANRAALLDSMTDLPTIVTATQDEVMRMVEQRRLYGLGLGLVDVHLLASVLLDAQALLWTRDKRLLAAAADVGVRSLAVPDLIR